MCYIIRTGAFVVIEDYKTGGKVMSGFILFILPVLALAIGLLLYFVGKAKKNIKLKSVGVGFIVCLVILESPDLIQGFIRGFANGIR